MPSSTTVSVADLVGRPGASRPVSADLDLPADLELPLAVVDGPVALDGVLESVVDGILVRGRLRMDLRLSCARCLQPVDDSVGVDVAELYSDPESADDREDVEAGYEIRDDAIDLDALLRDALAPAVPVAPRCREDCAGLCADCGADLNEGPHAHHEDAADPRWSALVGLRLDADRDA